MRAIFFNSYGRLRSGWRFAVFILSFSFSGIVLGRIAQALLDRLPTGFGTEGTLFFLLNGALSLTVALVLGWQLGKLLEGLPFHALGAAFKGNWLKNFLLGSGIGAISLALAILMAVIFGGLSFKLNIEQPGREILITLVVSLGVFAVAAAFEEAFFRGYILQTFSRAGLAWLAIILTSLFFALAHIRNPGATWISTANTALAGVWFGVAYLKTRDLWLPFGIHLMWNWVQGSVFGVEVSGLKDILRAPLLREIDRGPAWLTGENYGIEASICCTVVIVMCTIAIYFMPFLKPAQEMLELTSREQPLEGVKSF